MLRKVREDLERHVQGRTTELAATNEALQKEITDRIHVEEALRQSVDRFELAVQGMNEGVWDATFQATPTGHFVADRVYYSPRFKALLAYTGQQFPDRYETWENHLHPEDKERVRLAFHDHLTQGIQYTPEFRLRTKTGAYRWFLGGGQAEWDAHGHPLRMAGSLQDITVRKEAEQLKDELVSTVSHELRTPLANLRGYAELMLTRTFTPEKKHEFIAIIHSEAIRLTNLINDFLDVQRLESGKSHYEFAGLELLPFLHESVAVFQGMEGRHTFRIDAPAALFIRADKGRLQQVLANLLSNAVKFSPAGGEIAVGAARRDAEAVVWVKDHGLGMPAEALPQLFHKFFRVDNGATREIGGTGLGLALSKGIIEAHKGDIWVESAPGQGSTFFFTLPVDVSVFVAEAQGPVQV